MGFLKDIYFNIGGMIFKIDDEVFLVSGSLWNFIVNMLVNLVLKGIFNFVNIEKVLFIELE